MKRIIAGFAAMCLCAGVAWAVAGFGVGATFPYPLYANWANAYFHKTGVGINYQSIGSGGGIAQIEAATATFGASDIPLSPALLQKHDLIQFPTVIGGIVPVVHLRGIKPGELVLNGPVLAKIFSGKIRKWNDPAIIRLNPGVRLPDQVIEPLTRSDKSGTTFTFTRYLSRFDKSWRQRIGVAPAVNWPVDLVIGVKGTEGVANTLIHTHGSIGYVEFTYARQNNLAWTRMINHDGEVVQPTRASFEAAARHGDWQGEAGNNLVFHLMDRAGAGVWPMTAATYVLLHNHTRTGRQPGEIRSVKDFWLWCFAHGDGIARALGYVPLPDKVKLEIRQRIEK